MRLRLQEALDAYNERHGHQMTLRELALRLYTERDTIDQTKINRISALNTGKKTASISELADLSEILECDCMDLL